VREVGVWCRTGYSSMGPLCGLLLGHNASLTLNNNNIHPFVIFFSAIESVGKEKRDICSVGINYFYAVGEAMIGGVAWISQDWVTIQLALSVPPFIFSVYYW